MSRQTLFENILRSLHAGVFDDARWPAISGLIDEFCGTKGNFLVCGDGATHHDVDILFAQFCFRGQRRTDMEREYFEVFHAVDERLPRIRQLPDAQVVPVPSLFTQQEMASSVVYNDAMRRGVSRDGLNVRLDGPDGSRIVWAVADSVDGPGWSVAQVKRFEGLLPHLRQFVRVRHALVNRGALGCALGDLLENIRMGIIQLDRRARVVAANAVALGHLRKGDGLLDVDGLLRASMPSEDVQLQRLLASALPFLGEVGASGSMLVSRANSLPRLVVHVSPVGEAGGAASHRSRIGALVLVVDPVERREMDPEQVGKTLGLTPAESRVALLLAQGKTTAEIASVTGTRRTTVRWHLAHIFSKLGVSCQMEVAQVVSALADMPGIRR